MDSSFSNTWEEKKWFWMEKLHMTSYFPPLSYCVYAQFQILESEMFDLSIFESKFLLVDSFGCCVGLLGCLGPWRGHRREHTNLMRVVHLL